MFCNVADYRWLLTRNNIPYQQLITTAKGLGEEREGQAGVLTSTCDLKKVRNEVRVPGLQLQVFHCCSTDS